MSKHKVKLLQSHNGKNAGDTVEIDITEVAYYKGMGLIDPNTKINKSAQIPSKAETATKMDAPTQPKKQADKMNP